MLQVLVTVLVWLRLAVEHQAQTVFKESIFMYNQDVVRYGLSSLIKANGMPYTVEVEDKEKLKDFVTLERPFEGEFKEIATNFDCVSISRAQSSASRFLSKVAALYPPPRRT